MTEKKINLFKKHKAYNGTVEYNSHASESTQTTMKFSLFRPSKSKKEKRPALLFLSGLTCTEENFITKANALEMAESLGIFLICPDTSPRGTNLSGEDSSWDFGSGASFYVNATTLGWCEYYRMYDYIAEELPELIGANFPIQKDNMSLFGHSMGGLGALVIALRNPNNFKSCSAFAPISSPTRCQWGIKAFTNYLGKDEKTWEQYDPCLLLSKAKKVPPILIDQGTEDEFLEAQLKTTLLEEAIKRNTLVEKSVKLRWQSGYDHSFYFVSSFIKDHLEFHAEHILDRPKRYDSNKEFSPST